MRYITLLLTGFILLSCSSNDKQEKQKNNSSGGIDVITEKELQEIILSRNGKTLFLNVWATWCIPCVEEFPELVKLNDNYKNKNVEVIALSVDLPSEINEKVIPFLKEQKADFKVYVAQEKSSDEIINMLDPEWSGAIPVSVLFDKKGRKQKFLTGTQTYKEMSLSIDSVRTL